MQWGPWLASGQLALLLTTDDGECVLVGQCHGEHAVCPPPLGPSVTAVSLTWQLGWAALQAMPSSRPRMSPCPTSSKPSSRCAACSRPPVHADGCRHSVCPGWSTCSQTALQHRNHAPSLPWHAWPAAKEYVHSYTRPSRSTM